MTAGAQPPLLAPMRILTTSDGSRLSYRVFGSGPPLVFLHGWSSGAQEWFRYAEALAPHYRVICWNARGHDPVLTDPGQDMSLERMAEDLQELLTREAPQGALLVGHSMGALTAWAHIRRYGDGHLGGLCVLDQSPCLLTGEGWSLGIHGHFDSHHNQHFIRRLRRDFADTVIRLIGGQLDDPDPLPQTLYVQRLRDYLNRLPGEALTRCWESLTAADLRPVLSAIQRPTLLVYGDRSQFYGPAVAQWVQGRITGSRLIRYPEADHSPHLGDTRDRFLADLGAFARQVLS